MSSKTTFYCVGKWKKNHPTFSFPLFSIESLNFLLSCPMNKNTGGKDTSGFEGSIGKRTWTLKGLLTLCLSTRIRGLIADWLSRSIWSICAVKQRDTQALQTHYRDVWCFFFYCCCFVCFFFLIEKKKCLGINFVREKHCEPPWINDSKRGNGSGMVFLRARSPPCLPSYYLSKRP